MQNDVPQGLVDGAAAEVRRVHSGERVAGLRMRNVGNGLARVAEPVDGLTIEDLNVDGVYRVLENTAARGGPDATLTGLRMRNVTATNVLRGVARLRYDSHDGEIVDVKGTGTVNNDGIPCGIAFDGTAHDFTLERCVMRGFQMELAADRYWNGDGFSSELGNYGLRFLRCEAYDNSDGGFDLKSTGTFLDGCVSGGNKRNYRFWSTMEAHVITSLTPVLRGGSGNAGHVYVDGAHQPVVTIGKLIVRSDTDAPVLLIHAPGATVVIASHDIQVPKGTPLAVGDAATIVWKSGAPLS